MTLTLTITSEQRAQPGVEPFKVFGEDGGTIGRSRDNDWVLPDPSRYVSSHHGRVDFRDGGYYITDVSLNGLFVNGHRLGNGNSALLATGDRLGIGDYEVAVSSQPEPVRLPPSAEVPTGAYVPELPAEERSPVAVPGHVPSLRPGAELAAPAGEALGPVIPVDLDLSDEPPDLGPPQRDDLAPIHEAFQPPPAAREIPDRWWEERSAPATGAPGPATPEARPGQEPLPPPAPEEVARTLGGRQLGLTELPTVDLRGPPPPLTARPAREGPLAGPTPASVRLPATAASSAFLAALGLPPGEVSVGDDTELMGAVGRMFREMVEGIVELLMARASIKSEARLPLTTIRPVLNNPLKFSVGADDALRKLFGAERAAGFLAPEEAVRDAVQDLKAHQLAVIAGLQATLKDLFNRFDPERLEREFSERSLLGTILPLHRKAKCWTLFTDEFRKIAREAEDDFQRLFGREFARAYQEQVRRMRAGDGSEGPRLGPRAGRAAARTAGSAPAVRVW